jgi:predicted Zn-ribbon and HTH transcriptional regulator
MELMSTEIVAGFTVLHITIAVIVLLIAGIALQSLRKEKPVGEDLLREANCPSCGWKGRLSKYQRKCPGCNGEL